MEAGHFKLNKPYLFFYYYLSTYFFTFSIYSVVIAAQPHVTISKKNLH